MQMPNVHYFEVGMSKFPPHVFEGNVGSVEVYLPVDKPSGIIYAELIRTNITSKLWQIWTTPSREVTWVRHIRYEYIINYNKYIKINNLVSTFFISLQNHNVQTTLFELIFTEIVNQCMAKIVLIHFQFNTEDIQNAF